MDIIIRLTADGLVALIAIIGFVTILRGVPRGQRLEKYSLILMAGLTTYLLAKLVGQVWQPSSERPFEILGVNPGALYLDNPGFPSDHAIFVTTIALAVWFTTRSKLMSLILAIGVVLVCVGRVVALVHTPIDVIFGVLIALVGALWYITEYTPTKRVEGVPKRR